MNQRFSEEMKGGFLSWSNLTFLILIYAGLFSGFAAVRYSPFPELEEFLKRECSVRVLDRRGEVIAVLPLENGLKREYAPLEDIPSHVQEIFILSEDRRFYLHPGVDAAALLRGFYQYLSVGEVISGGSTLTMQIARMISPGGEGVGGKLLEMVKAMRIELCLSKEKILQLYLNNIPFGYQVEGIASAARYFFNIPVELLAPEETAVLSVIPRNPGTYNPFTRKETVLKGAVRAGALLAPPIESQFIEKVLESIHPGSLPNLAPHFIGYMQSVGIVNRDDQFSSSLDLKLNGYLEERINFYLEKYRANRLYNGAGIVLDNRTGEIIGYVGTHDFSDSINAGQIDGVQVLNQPGSCLKPFLYALAIENGFRPNTILPDEPMDFGGEEVYVPMNFDNRYHGPVSLRVALASSLNVPAVYTLSQISVKTFTEFLLSIGFESLTEQKHSVGIGLALGNAEVSLMELARGFSVFPREGRMLDVTFLLQGNRREVGSSKQVLSPYAAGIITHILSDRSSRTLAFGQGDAFITGYPAMFKTGTANQHQNIWALGATPWYTVGIWLGNHSGQTVVGKTGSSLPLLAVRDILDSLQQVPVPFPLPEGAERVELCTRSGENALPACPATFTEYLPRGENPPVCSIHSHNQTVAKTIRIRKPLNGAVFYYDPQAAPSHQSILIEAEGGIPGDTAEVFVNGRYRETAEYPFRYRFSLKEGGWQVRFQTDTAFDQVTFTVR